MAWAAALAAAVALHALPPPFVEIGTGPGGGQLWRGLIRNSALPGNRRESIIYVPPGFSPQRRYPVIYLLHGFPGSPWSYAKSLGLANLGDSLIGSGAEPFVAVVPSGGPSGRYHGEWTGVWETYVVNDVMPWVRTHLRVRPGAAIGGLSAGAFGAVDIALRHPTLFDRVESWGGYFRPFHDGTLRNAGPEELAAHDPELLVRSEAPLLRRLGVRFFLSTGPSHGHVLAWATEAFANELRALRLPVSVVQVRSTRGEWERQLAAGLRWAFGGAALPSAPPKVTPPST